MKGVLNKNNYWYDVYKEKETENKSNILIDKLKKVI